MSNNLDRTDVTAAQNQKTVTIAESDGFLDAAITELTAFVVDNTNVLTLTAAEFTHNFVVQFNDDASPPTDLVTITVPVNQRGLFLVFNNMSFPMQIEISGQSGASPVVDVGERRILQSDGVDVLEAASAAPAFHGALVNLTGTQSINNATATIVGWDAEDYDKVVGRNQFWLGVNAAITTDFATDDRIDLTTHGMETGDGPFQFITTTTLPAGISLATDYWAIRVSANEFEIATSIANALAGTQVDITDDGTGTHTIDREARLVVPIGVTQVRLSAAIELAVDADGDRRIEIMKNGAVVLGGGAHSQKSPTTDPTLLGVNSAMLEVTEGDFFELEVEHNAGAATNLLNANSKTWFSIEEVRP